LVGALGSDETPKYNFLAWSPPGLEFPLEVGILMPDAIRRGVRHLQEI
jgi:hypothetical protein